MGGSRKTKAADSAPGDSLNVMGICEPVAVFKDRGCEFPGVDVSRIAAEADALAAQAMEMSIVACARSLEDFRASGFGIANIVDPNQAGGMAAFVKAIGLLPFEFEYNRGSLLVRSRSCVIESRFDGGDFGPLQYDMPASRAALREACGIVDAFLASVPSRVPDGGQGLVVACSRARVRLGAVRGAFGSGRDEFASQTAAFVSSLEDIVALILSATTQHQDDRRALTEKELFCREVLAKWEAGYTKQQAINAVIDSGRFRQLGYSFCSAAKAVERQAKKDGYCRSGESLREAVKRHSRVRR